MGRYSTFPALLDESKTIDITNLRKWDYLIPGEVKSGTIHWSISGQRYSSVSIQVNMFSSSPYLELSYKIGEDSINYKILLVSIPSNLNKGVLWYFVCPLTGKRCRKLHLVSGSYFLHRTAFKGSLYEKQTYSKKQRVLFSQFERVFAFEKYYEEVNQRYFKKYYSGRMTKRYRRCLRYKNK